VWYLRSVALVVFLVVSARVDAYDAGGDNRLPEAQSLLLLSTGLLIAGRLFRRTENETRK